MLGWHSNKIAFNQLEDLPDHQLTCWKWRWKCDPKIYSGRSTWNLRINPWNLKINWSKPAAMQVPAINLRFFVHMKNFKKIQPSWLYIASWTHFFWPSWQYFTNMDWDPKGIRDPMRPCQKATFQTFCHPTNSFDPLFRCKQPVNSSENKRPCHCHRRAAEASRDHGSWWHRITISFTAAEDGLQITGLADCTKVGAQLPDS